MLNHRLIKINIPIILNITIILIWLALYHGLPKNEFHWVFIEVIGLLGLIVICIISAIAQLIIWGYLIWGKFKNRKI